MPHPYDYIVVGAGAAGCVLAARLSEHAQRSVLLIEAGEDTPPGAEPADILDVYPRSYYNKAYFWPALKAWWRTSADGAPDAFSQARVMGGGGSVMGMVALRGTPADYVDWERAGAAGWGWGDVVPYYRKLERDLDFHGDMHGDSGPMPIRRLPRSEWPPLTRAIAEIAAERKALFIDDMNADFRDGIGAVPMCNTATHRASSGLCYLDAAARARPNLRIVTGAAVQRIAFAGRRAIGVEALVAGTIERFHAAEIIVSAGAIFSPALLQRSGIGRAEQLQALGIDVLADRPGVGADLQNHPLLFIGLWLEPHGRQPAHTRTNPFAAWRYSSGLPGCPPSDLYINIQSKTSWSALGSRIANIAPVVLRPLSRGVVALSSKDAHVAPRIEFNFLDHELDLERMIMAFKLSVAIVGDRRVRGLSRMSFPLRFSDRLRSLNEVNRANALKARLIAGMLDALPALTGSILGRLTDKRVDLQTLAADRDTLAAHLRENVAGVFHPVGTCRMGIAEDRNAVVDANGKVHGIGGLRVADASIMPTLPAGNTYLPALMVAEKIAAAIVAGR